MEPAAYALFLGFALVWAALFAGGWILLLKSDGQKIGFGKWGLVVAVPTLLPFVAALIFGAYMAFHA